MATDVTPPPQPVTGNTYGLSPWGFRLANASILGLFLLIFYQDRHAALQQAREDREIFRTAIEQIHQDSEKKWAALREQSATLERLTRAVEVIAREKKQ